MENKLSKSDKEFLFDVHDFDIDAHSGDLGDELFDIYQELVALVVSMGSMRDELEEMDLRSQSLAITADILHKV